MAFSQYVKVLSVVGQNISGIELVWFANKNKNCQLSYNLFQTSQIGGHQYSDTSPFSIPWFLSIRLYHPPDGGTSSTYKLLGFQQPYFILPRAERTSF